MKNFFEQRREIIGAREKLVNLEKEGNYLFHGSPFIIDKLEPRQPNKFNKETRENENHGEPCVAATSFSDIAIFRSLINSSNCNGSSSFGLDDNKTKFATTLDNLNQISDKVGYVYVLNKSDFVKFSDMEWRTDKEIIPTQVIEVVKKDLPININIIDNNFNALD